MVTLLPLFLTFSFLIRRFILQPNVFIVTPFAGMLTFIIVCALNPI